MAASRDQVKIMRNKSMIRIMLASKWCKTRVNKNLWTMHDDYLIPTHTPQSPNHPLQWLWIIFSWMKTYHWYCSAIDLFPGGLSIILISNTSPKADSWQYMWIDNLTIQVFASKKTYVTEYIYHRAQYPVILSMQFKSKHHYQYIAPMMITILYAWWAYV